MMINKQNLWFFTLFSLILVLSVYYITMPNDLLLKNKPEEKEVAKTDKVNVVVDESEILVSLRVDLEETRETMKNDLESILTSSSASSEEKNTAYEQLKYINIVVGQEEKIEGKIKSVHNLNSFVEIDDNEIEVIIVNKKHDGALANSIMRTVQEEYTEPMYITVKFK